MRKRGRPASRSLLTPREQEVLDLLRASLTNPEIGDRLGISVETVKQHVSEILSKLGVATREEAAARQPKTPRQQRKASRWAMVTAASALMAAAGVGVVLLAWGVWRGGGNDGDVSDLPSALSSSSCLLDPARTSIDVTASIDWTSRAVNLIEGSSDVELLSGSFQQGYAYTAPTVSPHADTIVIGANLRQPNGTLQAGLWAITAADKAQRLLLPTDNGATFEIDSPAFSPDGTQIAFTRVNVQHLASHGHEDKYEVWLIGADGTNPRKVFDGRNPRWSSDGRHVALDAQTVPGPPLEQVVLDAHALSPVALSLSVCSAN